MVICTARSQNISLDGNIYEYGTYYVNSFDLGTGATNVQIFRYELSSDQYPATIKINFRSTMLSPALGIENIQTIIEIETNPFIFESPIKLSKKFFSLSEIGCISIFDKKPRICMLSINIL